MKDYMSALNEQQRAVVEATHGPVLVLAGAGSGKTRALTHRIVHLLATRAAAPHEIVAVTFTNKAAAEMKERVQQLVGNPHHTPNAMSTFHSLGVRLLRENPGAHARSKQFIIVDAGDSERLIKQALKAQNLSIKEWKPRVMKSRISHAKNTGTSPQDILAASRGIADDVLASTFEQYEKLLQQHNAYDFDDLLLAPIAMLTRHEGIRSHYQHKWRFLSVDEYQDTNPTQERLLDLLLNKEHNICVVGDDYQAIYSWRGAQVDHILHFENKHPNCTTIVLTQNYRSTPRILSAANAVIAHNTAQKHKELWTNKTAGDAIQLVTVSSDRGEAQYIRRSIEDYVNDGNMRSNCAVLYRTNAQSRVLEEEFLTHRVPYTIVGGFRFYERREVKDALALLGFWVNPNARISINRLVDAIVSRVGPKTIDRWEAIAQQESIPLHDAMRRHSGKNTHVKKILDAYKSARERTFTTVADLLSYLLKHTAYRAWLEQLPDGEERLENIEELLNVTSAYEDVGTFLEEVALLSDIDTMDEQQDRITCMTLHASKGLEFKRVYIVGCEEGLLPHQNSVDTPAALEEERRLLYVGITRAQQSLILTHAASRYIGGNVTLQAPSQFLRALPDDIERIDLEYGQMGSSGIGIDPDPDDDIGAFVQERPAESHEASSGGTFITHPQFGKGVVISSEGTMVTCVFEGHGVKRVDTTHLTV